MKELKLIVEGRRVLGELTVSFEPMQYRQVSELLRSAGDAYKEDLSMSVRTSLDLSDVVNTSLSRDDENGVARFNFEGDAVVEKTEGRFLIQVGSGQKDARLDRGIGVLDALKVVLPPETALVSARPKPDKVSGGVLVWENFNWNRGLRIDFEKTGV